MAKISEIDLARVPEHIAVIMDGNGRWAKAQGKDRSEGHRAGVSALHDMIEAASKIGVRYLTVYTFSTENWNRPKEEVDTLMNLIAWAIEMEIEGMIANGVSLKVIGDMSRLPEFARNKLSMCQERTKDCNVITVVLALSYSSKWEITKAFRKIAEQVESGALRAEDVNENLIDRNLETAGIPDPELMIRTGGEVRISNYLLWQIAYSELYFSDTYWPDFGAEQLYDAVVEYQSRERRFGKTSEQVAK